MVQRNVPPTEEVLFSLENEERLLSLVGTSERLLVVRRNQFDRQWVKASAESYAYAQIADARHTVIRSLASIQVYVYVKPRKPNTDDKTPRLPPAIPPTEVETFVQFKTEQAVKIVEALRELVTTAKTAMK